MSGLSIFILAVEPSADKLGADLAVALREKDPNIHLSGIGGSDMARVGIHSDFDISELAIMGYVEVLKSYPVIRRKIKEAIQLILNANPQSVVLIDSWGFMIRVAEGLKKKGYSGQIIKYVAPQVWAMRAGRAKTLAKYADHLLTIQTMDKPYFDAVGLAQTFVGNPMFDEDFSPDHAGNFRIQEGLEDQQIILVLFGSRRGEVESLFEPFAGAIALLKRDFPDAQFVTIIASNIAESLTTLLENDPRTQSILIASNDDKKALFADADVALACSGTVTTQLAMSGTPGVVAYKLNKLTYSIGKHVFRPDHISLVNISANERIMPEFLQDDVTPEKLSQSVARLLKEPDLHGRTSNRLLGQIETMKGKGGSASQRAASAIINLMGAS